MGLSQHLGLLISHLPRALLAAENETRDSPTSTSPSPSPAPPSSKSSLSSFRPGIAVIVGVVTTMFSLTFLLLLYAKHCKRSGGGGGYGGGGRSGMAVSSRVERRNSGVERAVVESLPVFRFGSLLGQKEGLECAVCLSRFEPAEALRLLPKCRHAFHVECVDVWLDAHSTCPLCRLRVDPEDVLLLPHDPRTDRQPGPGPSPEPNPSSDKPRASKSGGPYTHRVSGRHSSAGEKSSCPLQIVVHRADPSQPPPRSRRSVDSFPLRSTEPGKRKDGLLLSEQDRERFAHRIVVSNSEPAQERWSDLRPSDLLFLRSEMIITDSGRFSASRAPRASSSSAAGSGGVINSRCASEITGLSRFPPSANIRVSRRAEEERTMRRWLGFGAKRTAQWLASRGGGGDAGVT